jgi:hypothetical protein
VRRDPLNADINGRRMADHLRLWFPILVVLIGWLVSLGVFYGKLDGRFTLLEYRLDQIEKKLP